MPYIPERSKNNPSIEICDNEEDIGRYAIIRLKAYLFITSETKLKKEIGTSTVERTNPMYVRPCI